MVASTVSRVLAGLVRRTWLVGVTTVIVCSAFAAHAVAALVEARYLDTPPLSARHHGRQQVQIAPDVSPTPDGSDLVARNMFCSTCTPGPVSGGPGPADSFVPPAVLIATSIGGVPYATVRVPASEVQGDWEVGDVIPGIGTVDRIGFVSIDVRDRDGRVGTLSLLDPLQPAPPPGGHSDGGAATPAPAAASPFADRIKKIDGTTYDVDRALVRELVTGGDMKLAGARIVPITKDGKLDGLRLFGVRPNALASSLGLMNSDVIQAVNNTKIESANTLLDLYAQLDKLDTVTIEGTRKGKPLTLTLRLR